MSDRMAVASPREEVKEESEEKKEVIRESIPMYQEVPIDLIRHFDVNFGDLSPKTKDKLKDIYKMLDGDTLAKKFQSLIRIELKLGRSGSDRRRFHKVWNWLKINHNIKSQRNIEKDISRKIALEASQSGSI